VREQIYRFILAVFKGKAKRSWASKQMGEWLQRRNGAAKVKEESGEPSAAINELKKRTQPESAFDDTKVTKKVNEQPKQTKAPASKGKEK
jgi:hypothetical protein